MSSSSHNSQCLSPLVASQYPCGRSWNSGFLFRPFMIKPHLRFLSKFPSHVLHSVPTQKIISKPVAVTFLGSQEKPHRDSQPITQQTPRTLCASPDTSGETIWCDISSPIHSNNTYKCSMHPTQCIVQITHNLLVALMSRQQPTTNDRQWGPPARERGHKTLCLYSRVSCHYLIFLSQTLDTLQCTVLKSPTCIRTGRPPGQLPVTESHYLPQP